VIIEIFSKITGGIVKRDMREGVNCCLQYRRNWGISESSWTKTGGEMLENVNGRFVLLPAVYYILLVVI